MFDILINGLGGTGSEWHPAALPLDEVVDRAGAEVSSAETFFIAATRLINERGYRGASVEKISARLNVTKGSFYHHNDAKDDLVVECFERSFETMRRIQRAVALRSHDQWSNLATVATALVNHQLSDRGPLLRTSALSALPLPMRDKMVERSNRVSDRFAASISDGIAEGSVRAVDPFIAAQMLTATLNAAAEIRWWIPDVLPENAATLYAKPMLMGIFSR
jgi:AcrR family transcriptional regulator